MPGSKEFLQKFEDKQTLIKLDHKLQNGEDLTKEELSFLYELDRPIATLDTYNDEDPRITELKEKYDLEYALEKGVDVNKLVSSLNTDDILENLDSLLKHGADVDVNGLVSSLKPDIIAYNLDSLLKHGADINNVVGKMDHYGIADNLDYLLNHGADINNIVNNMNSKDIAKNLYYFLRYYGADVNNVVRNLDEEDIKNNIDLLRKHGAKLDTYQGNN